MWFELSVTGNCKQDSNVKFLEMVLMQLMWDSWTSLVIYVNLDILPRRCEVSSQRGLAGPSYIDRDMELRKRIAFALSGLLQSRPWRVIVHKWYGILCVQPHSLFRLQFAPSFHVRFWGFLFVFLLIGRFVYSFLIFWKNSGKVTSCAAPCSGG